MQREWAGSASRILHDSSDVRSMEGFQLANDGGSLNWLHQSIHEGWQGQCRGTAGDRSSWAGGIMMRVACDVQR